MLPETTAERGVNLWLATTTADSYGDPTTAFVWDPDALVPVRRANIVRGTSAGTVVQAEGIVLEQDEALLVAATRLRVDETKTRVVTALGECWDIDGIPRVRRALASGWLTSIRLKRSAAVIPA